MDNALFKVIEYIIVTITPLVVLVSCILRHEHLRKRDTVDAVRIFRISMLIIVAVVMEPLLYLVSTLFFSFLSDASMLSIGYFVILVGITFEVLTLIIIIEWNKFVDYVIYKSQDHVKRKLKRAILMTALISIPFFIYYFFFDDTSTMMAILQGLLLLIYFMEVFYVGNAIWIVLKASKRRKPPTKLRLDAFIIPLILGYISATGLVPVDYDLRFVFLSIGILLTWRRVEKRYEYMDPITGLYNRQYLMAMNEYMEKKGYPNGIGIYFGAPGSNGKLVDILDQIKPEDAEIFSIGEDEYLMMAGSQSESAIKWVIKSLRVGVEDLGNPYQVNAGYTLRGDDETYEAFTKRLLEMDWEKEGNIVGWNA